MMEAMIRAMKTDHPHIVRRPGVCGGSPVIEGTRIPVRLIAGYVNDGIMDAGEIVRAYPNLTLAQVYDALAYYHDHKSEIDEELRQNTEEFVLKKFKLQKDKHGVLRRRSQA
jgi:uncharacterized protein (DUF433 family)